jgi:hypothetical protein
MLYKKSNGARDEEVQRDRWNYSQTLRLVTQILAARQVLAPLVRIWHRGGKDVRIGFARAEKKVILGGGPSFKEAFHNVFIAPGLAKEEIQDTNVNEPGSPVAPQV